MPDYSQQFNSGIAEAIAQAASSTTEVVYKFPAGTFPLESPIVVSPRRGPVRLIGRNTILQPAIDFDKLIRLGNSSYGSGNISQWSSFTRHNVSDVARGATTITIPSKPSLTAPFYAVLYDETKITTLSGTFYIQQQLVLVTEYSATTGIATLARPTAFAFATVSGVPPKLALCEAQVSVGFALEGITLNGRVNDAATTQTQQGVWCGLVWDPDVQGIVAYGYETDAVRFEFCAGGGAFDVRIADMIKSGASLGRGVTVNNSVGITVDGIYGTGCRHVVTVSVGSSDTTIRPYSASDMGDNAWDLDHGLGAQYTTLDGEGRPIGGDIQLGNGSYSNGGRYHTVKNCKGIGALRFVGDVRDVTVENCECQTVNFQGTDLTNTRWPKRITLTDCTFNITDTSATNDPMSVSGFSDENGSTASISCEDVTFVRCAFGQAASAGGRRCVNVPTAQTKCSLTFTSCAFVNPGTGSPVKISAGSPVPDVDIVFSGSYVNTGGSYFIELDPASSSFGVGSTHAITNTTLAAGGGSGILYNPGGVAGNTPT